MVALGWRGKKGWVMEGLKSQARKTGSDHTERSH